MIGKITGSLIELHGAQGLIQTQSGLAYRVWLTPGLMGQVGETLSLYTHLHVREDELTLFGFESNELYVLYTQFIAIDGVGPKTAFTIISTTTPADIRMAVSTSNVAYFQKIKGIGKKTAQRILIDLASVFGSEFDLEASAQAHDDEDVVRALISLGFTAKDARSSLEHVDPSLPLEKRITQALQGVSRSS